MFKTIKMLDDENSTILWEPGSRTTPVYYSGVDARIIATVSPNKYRIHEFKKEAKMFFMPVKVNYRLMGQVYQRFATDLRNCPTDAEIHLQVKCFGLLTI